MTPAKAKALKLLGKALTNANNVADLAALAKHIETLNQVPDEDVIAELEKKFLELKGSAQWT